MTGAVISSCKQDIVMSNYALGDLHVLVMLHTIARRICKLTNAVTFVWTKSESASKVIRRPLRAFDVGLADVIREKVGEIGVRCRGRLFLYSSNMYAKKGDFSDFWPAADPARS